MKRLLLTFAVFLWAGLQIALAQSRPVKGQVLDENGEGIPGASVKVKGTTAGTITDIEGNFQLDVPNEENSLVISALGYAPQEVEAGDGAAAVSVSLVTSSTQLGETVVIGYGTTTYKELNGATSVVEGESLADKPVGTFTNMLQGQASGVQVTAVNGAPGAAAFIRIRGTSSINPGASEPLIVIDGIPATAEALNAINPNDIDDVTILKDASTTSIYGSRGANGVVMVTTKKGKAGADARPSITYGFQYGWKTKTPDKFELMNFEEKLAWEREMGYTNEYLQGAVTDAGYTGIEEVPEGQVGAMWDALRPNETNWMSHKRGENPILRVGKFQQHDIGISGGTEKLRFYLSGQLYDEDGTASSSFFSRKSGNVDVEYKANNWLKIGQNVRVSYSNGRLLRDRFNAQNPFAAIYLYNPYESPYDFATGINGYNPTTQGFNIVEAMQNNPSFYNNTYLLSSTYAEVTPIENLTLRSQLGMQFNSRQQENFTRPGSILDIILNRGVPTGSKTDIVRNRFNYVWANTAEYVYRIDEANRITGLIGTEFTKDNYKGYSLTSTGYPLGVSTQENSSTPTATTTTRAAWTLMSYFARVQYSHLGKYTANVSFRRDGSSRFGADTKWGNFLAGGASWMISDENFLSNNSFINILKLWGSVGTSGNNEIGNYSHLASTLSFAAYNNQTVAFPAAGSAGNESLTWEKNLNYSVGLDYGLWQNRIIGSLAIYGRKTTDMLVFLPIPSTTGFTTQPSNIGAAINRGLEFNVNVDIIRTTDLTWSVGGNITFNKNTLTDFGGQDTVSSLYSLFGYYVVGQPIDVYRLRKYAGVDAEDGAPMWYTEDGATTKVYGDAHQFILEGKSPDPRYFGGFYTNVNYKGLELGVNFSYTGGHWTYNNQWMQANMFGNYYTNLSKEMLDYWTPENTDAINPAPDFNDGTYDSDRWLEKASYLRLRNITLAYTMPAKMFNNKIQGIRVYLQGHNLWYTAPGYHGDPEIGVGSDESDLTRVGNTSLYSYPQSKGFTLGLNVFL